MRMHEREQLTNIAESALALAMYQELGKYDLTDGEFLRVVSGACSSVLGGLAKRQIRMERHGDTETPGGWAPEEVG